MEAKLEKIVAMLVALGDLKPREMDEVMKKLWGKDAYTARAIMDTLAKTELK